MPRHLHWRAPADQAKMCPTGADAADRPCAHDDPLHREGEMLKKRRFRKENVVKVTFSVPADTAEREVQLLGDFNGWTEPQPLARQKDGSWRTTVPLDPDGEYRFRYLADGQRWLNDPDADRTEPNEYGSENSIVVT
jgi:1,4-alpha-glucan branching enzyme